MVLISKASTIVPILPTKTQNPYKHKHFLSAEHLRHKAINSPIDKINKLINASQKDGIIATIISLNKSCENKTPVKKY